MLLNTALPTVVRGNGSEIMSVAGAHVQTKGVDSSAAANAALGSARALVQRHRRRGLRQRVTDHIVDGTRWALLNNGHVGMTRITGIGCSATALVAAFCAVQPDAWRATVSAMALMGLAGEIAAEKATVRRQGVGTMQALLLDELQLLDQAHGASPPEAGMPAMLKPVSTPVCATASTPVCATASTSVPASPWSRQRLSAALRLYLVTDPAQPEGPPLAGRGASSRARRCWLCAATRQAGQQPRLVCASRGADAIAAAAGHSTGYQ